jgi:hypothetical protein
VSDLVLYLDVAERPAFAIRVASINESWAILNIIA